jgi:hypothetical protein
LFLALLADCTHLYARVLFKATDSAEITFLDNRAEPKVISRPRLVQHLIIVVPMLYQKKKPAL